MTETALGIGIARQNACFEDLRAVAVAVMSMPPRRTL